jgi:hypothetical protein
MKVEGWVITSATGSLPGEPATVNQVAPSSFE